MRQAVGTSCIDECQIYFMFIKMKFIIILPSLQVIYYYSASNHNTLSHTSTLGRFGDESVLHREK